MAMNIQIRQATLEDLRAVSSLSQALFEYEKAFTNEYDLAWSNSADGQKFFTRRLKSRSMFILVAEVDGHIVGYVSVCIAKVSFRLYSPIAEIENLCVDPSYRGKGIGTTLVREVLRIVKTRGAKRLRVTALSNNDQSLHFYRMNGYKDVDVILERDVAYGNSGAI